MGPEETGEVAAEPLAPVKVKGRVQTVLRERGYGFIRCTDTDSADHGKDFFFHETQLLGCVIEDLEEGEDVRFTPRHAAKGKRAEAIERVAAPGAWGR